MRVRGDWLSQVAWRAFTTADNEANASIGRLSTGMRINSAADDASGLAQSQKVFRLFGGLRQANRNAKDGLSLVNTAEGALGTIHELLQRARELAVRSANDTLTPSDRKTMQDEVDQLMNEIDRISDMVEFNGQKLFSTNGRSMGQASILMGLRSGWLSNAETVIANEFGLTGNGGDIKVLLELSGSDATWISGTAGPGGRYSNVNLHINLSQFESGGGLDGGSGPVFNDRKVARALTQAVLSRNANFDALDRWLVEGLSSYIAGGDEDLAAAVSIHGTAGVLQALAPWTTWADDDLHRASAYLAVKYLDSQLPGTIKTFLNEFVMGNDLDTAIQNTIGLPSAWDFLNDFSTPGGGGETFINNYISSGQLSDPAVGAIGGGDAVGVIPNGGGYTLNPLSGFNVSWGTAASAKPIEFTLQVGADSGNTLNVSFSQISTYTLNLVGLNVITESDRAMTVLKTAIESISQSRTYLGSVSNRLDRIINVNEISASTQIYGYSQIVDLDFAKELSHLARDKILVASSSAMLAQSNTVRQNVLWLLNGVPGINAMRPGLSGIGSREDVRPSVSWQPN